MSHSLSSADPHTESSGPAQTRAQVGDDAFGSRPKLAGTWLQHLSQSFHHGKDADADAFLQYIVPESPVSVLPTCGITCTADTKVGVIEEELLKRSDIQGIIIVAEQDGALCAMMSRRIFFEFLSKAFAREISVKRPIRAMLSLLSLSTHVVDYDELIVEVVESLHRRPKQLVYEPVVQRHSDGSFSLLDVRTLLRAFTWISHVQNRELMRTQERLLKAKSEIEEVNQEIMQSLEYASMIQKASLPALDHIATQLGEHFLLWRQRGLVGGDYYWYQAVGSGCVVMVIDCTGHGVPGAFMTLIVSSMLRELMAVLDPQDPGRLLKELNHHIKSMLNQFDGETAASDDGLEAGICYVERPAKVLRYAGAGIDLLRVDSQGSVDRIGADRKGIGYTTTPASYTYRTQEFAVAEPGCYYMFTDGVTDIIGGPKKIAFGRKRLGQVLADNRHLPMPKQREAVVRALDGWRGCGDVRDDMTMVGFRL